MGALQPAGVRHTAKPRPGDGYAYRASYVADNDLALGKFIDLLSHSRFWPEMAVFITEDDAQNGRDHVDAHRSVLLVVSPFSRRNVSHAHTSMLSILKTLERIMGLPPLNQYDAAATDLADSFTDVQDVSPYVALPSDTRIFDPGKARDPLYSLSKGKPLPPSEALDDPTRLAMISRRQIANYKTIHAPAKAQLYLPRASSQRHRRNP